MPAVSAWDRTALQRSMNRVWCLFSKRVFSLSRLWCVVAIATALGSTAAHAAAGLVAGCAFSEGAGTTGDPNDWAQLGRYRGANAALAAPAAGERCPA